MRKHFIIFAFLLSLFAACKEKEETSAVLGLKLETENATYKSDGRFVYIDANCDWTLSLETITEGGNTSWARLNKTFGSGKTTAVLSYDHNGTEMSRSLVVKLTASDGTSVTAGFVQSGITLDTEEAGHTQTDTGNRPAWMELPEATNNLKYYSHSFNYSGKSYRNYSLGWDSSCKVAQWIAYPLCPFYTKKNVSRTDEWGYDPYIPVSEQADLFKSYSGNYDRGHQIPSADRLVSREANVQTFYFSNMTPQMGSFNQTVWGNVEGTVRGWSSNADTLYVVTGCVVSPNASTTTDASGKRCPIPSAYYKAVLRYSKSSTVGVGGYSAIGIYLDHKSYNANQSLTKSMVMSISQLEKKLGYELYVNLDDKIGAEGAKRVKSEDPTSVKLWGLK